MIYVNIYMQSFTAEIHVLLKRMLEAIHPRLLSQPPLFHKFPHNIYFINHIANTCNVSVTCNVYTSHLSCLMPEKSMGTNLSSYKRTILALSSHCHVSSMKFILKILSLLLHLFSNCT